MRYLVIERFRHGARPVYERFAAAGRQLPVGLSYVESWVTSDLARCYQLMDADDESCFADWIRQWEDLVEFEIVPVLTSAEARQRVLGG